jgi:hypothetical protein
MSIALRNDMADRIGKLYTWLSGHWRIGEKQRGISSRYATAAKTENQA